MRVRIYLKGGWAIQTDIPRTDDVGKYVQEKYPDATGMERIFPERDAFTKTNNIK